MGSAIHGNAESPTPGHLKVPSPSCQHLCPVASACFLPSKEKPGGEVLSHLSNIPLLCAFLIWKRKHRKALAFRKWLPSRKAALSHPHLPQGSHTLHLAHCSALLSPRSDELGRLEGMGTEKAKDRPRRPASTGHAWFPESKGLMLVGALTQV